MWVFIYNTAPLPVQRGTHFPTFRAIILLPSDFKGIIIAGTSLADRRFRSRTEKNNKAIDCTANSFNNQISRKGDLNVSAKADHTIPAGEFKYRGG